MISGTAFSPGSQRYRRVYKGAQILTSSGTWNKSTALSQPFLSEIDAVDLELEIVVIGGGAAGVASATILGGGKAGTFAQSNIRISDLPDTVDYTIGSGGVGSNNPGGTTFFGSIARAIGGFGQVAVETVSTLPAMRGPGNGGGNGNSRRLGGASNFFDPTTSKVGGAEASAGVDAASAFEFGSGGGGGSSSSNVGGNGGAPGGGGGSNGAGLPVGSGGRGGIYLRYYAWEPVA